MDEIAHMNCHVESFTITEGKVPNAWIGELDQPKWQWKIFAGILSGQVVCFHDWASFPSTMPPPPIFSPERDLNSIQPMLLILLRLSGADLVPWISTRGDCLLVQGPWKLTGLWKKAPWGIKRVADPPSLHAYYCQFSHQRLRVEYNIKTWCS